MRLRNLPSQRYTRHAQDVYPLPPALFAIFALETIARRRPVSPLPPRMDDMRDAMPVPQEEAARRGTRDGAS